MPEAAGGPQPFSRAHVAFAQQGTTMRVVVEGELDVATVPAFRAVLTRPRPAHAERIVIDLERVTFIDSSGLNALLDATEDWGERLRILPGPATARLLDITGLHGSLPITGSVGAVAHPFEAGAAVRPDRGYGVPGVVDTAGRIPMHAGENDRGGASAGGCA